MFLRFVVFSLALIGITQSGKAATFADAEKWYAQASEPTDARSLIGSNGAPTSWRCFQYINPNINFYFVAKHQNPWLKLVFKRSGDGILASQQVEGTSETRFTLYKSEPPSTKKELSGVNIRLSVIEKIRVVDSHSIIMKELDYRGDVFSYLTCKLNR